MAKDTNISKKCSRPRTKRSNAPTYPTNVQGLANSKAGKSTTTGHIFAHTVNQNCTLNVHVYREGKKDKRGTIDTPKSSNGSRKKGTTNAVESGQGNTQEILQGETCSENREVFDPAREFHKYEKRAVPTRKAIEKSKHVFGRHNILILNGCLGEGAFHLIKKLLKADYKTHHLRGFDELKSTYKQEQDKYGQIHVFVIWRPSEPVDEEVEKILKTKNKNLKFIIHSECSVLEFGLKEDFTVNLAEINSEENKWRDRLDLMKNIPEANKVKITKQHLLAFPLMCVMYKKKKDIFKNEWRAFSLLIKRIISCTNRSTEAGLIVMAMSKGRFLETEYDLYADKILKIVKDVTKKSICESLVSLKDSILKVSEGVWEFSSDAWRHGCMMHIMEEHEAVANFLLYPKKRTGWLSCLCKISLWFIKRCKTFVKGLSKLIRELLRPITKRFSS